MKKRFIISTLMVLFLGTVAFAQDILSPKNGDVIKIQAGENVCIKYYTIKLSLTGPVPYRDFYYKVFKNGEFQGSPYESPYCLSLTPGTYTVNIEYWRKNTNTNNFVLVDYSGYVTFTVEYQVTPLPCGCLPGQCSH